MTNLAQRHAIYADVIEAPPHLVAELIDGALTTRQHGSARHAIMRAALVDAFAKRRELCCLPLPEIHFQEHILVPDMAGWRPDALNFDGSPWSAQPTPSWVLEIAFFGTSASGFCAKKRIYAVAGIQHLWLLTPSKRLLEALQLVAGSWMPIGLVVDDAPVSLPPFDAISVPLSDLFPFDAPPSAEPTTEG